MKISTTIPTKLLSCFRNKVLKTPIMPASDHDCLEQVKNLQTSNNLR